MFCSLQTLRQVSTSLQTQVAPNKTAYYNLLNKIIGTKQSKKIF